MLTNFLNFYLTGTFIKGETMAYLDFKGTDRQHYADCKDTYGVNCYDPKTPRAETFTDLVSLITTLNLDVNDRKSKLPQWLGMFLLCFVCFACS